MKTTKLLWQIYIPGEKDDGSDDAILVNYYQKGGYKISKILLKDLSEVYPPTLLYGDQ